MLASETHLQPTNAPPLEQAAAGTTVLIDGIPVPIRDLWDPWTCPESHLPWLAETLSVDFWDESWPLLKKRAVVAESLALHRKKGSIFALRRYADLAGGEVTKVIRPPQKVYSGASLTRSERDAWHETLPQVRVWRRRDIRSRPYLLISGGPGRSAFFEGKFAQPSTPMERVARYVVDGVEKDAEVTDFGSYYRVHIPSTRGAAVFSGDILGQRFWIPSRAGERLFTVQPRMAMPSRAALGPRLRAVTAEPYLVAENAPRGYGVFAGDILGRQFWVPTDAHERLYHRWPILLPGSPIRRAINRMACQFMGVGFYRWPRHTLRLHVRLPGKRSPRQAGEGIIVPHSRFWLKHDPRPLRMLRRALTAAKSGHDTIYLRTAEAAGLRIGKPLLVGDRLIVGRP